MEAQLHIPADSHLKEYITFIWEVYGGRNISETILPKGIFEMVFNLADSMDGILPYADKVVRTPQCFIQGINTHVINANYIGRQHLFGIRLQPHMVKDLLGIMPSELNNIIVDMTLIKPEFKIIWEQLVEAHSFEDRVKVIETIFPILAQTDDIRTQKLSSLFMANSIQDFQSLDNLTQEIYYSSRHLNRKSQSIFGLSAEELIIYKKFLHSVNLMHSEKTTLTDIAYRSGFYDQSHFCRVFKNYTGITAKEYKNNKSDLPFHLFS